MLLIGDCWLMESTSGSAGSLSYWVSGKGGQEDNAYESANDRKRQSFAPEMQRQVCVDRCVPREYP